MVSGKSNEMKEGYILGKEVSLDSLGMYKMFISENRHVRCFLGYQSEDQLIEGSYSGPSVAARYPKARKSSGFITLEKGVIQRSRFLADDMKYKVLEDWLLIFPASNSPYFGVVSREDRVEHKGLTRAIFGGTTEESMMAATSFAKLTGRWTQFPQQPRITISNYRDNYCGLTGCVIPQKFPYLAFADSRFDWGHVSLFGFYRMLDICCSTGGKDSMRQRMLNSGVGKKLLDQLFGCARGLCEPLRKV